MRELQVNLQTAEYKISIKKNITWEIGAYLRDNFPLKKIAIITDNNVKALYGKELENNIRNMGFEIKTISIKPGEESKSLDTLEKIYEELSKFNLCRDDVIVAFGGGVVGDLAGFVASTYLRGVQYIQVPTSLLAQVDSSIGGKVAVDLPYGKNLIGSFYHPKKVFIDPELLKTLDRRFLNDGLAEVIKYGCIKDKSIIEQLLSYKSQEELFESIDSIIYKCCTIKKVLVERDERDYGERMLLNFGHTLGHAIEKYFDFKKYTHGEAVAIGMVQITKNTEGLGITEKGALGQLQEVLEKFQLLFDTPEMEREAVIKAIMLDKKNNSNGIKLIILKTIGQGIIKVVGIDELKNYVI